ncbi:ribonuclease H-like domain-containing protein [Tanacetum coccineum]
MVGASSSKDLISNLDLGNLLYLQNSDFSSSTIVSLKLTDTENYRVWVAAMKLATNTRNKTGFIDGTCVKSTYASSALLSNQWERGTLTDVKDAFAIIFREESHRGIASSFGYVSKPQVSSFVSKNNNWSSNGNKSENGQYGRKRISDKRTKNEAKNDKTKHGMEEREKTKSNQSQSQQKSKSKSTPQKVNSQSES